MDKKTGHMEELERELAELKEKISQCRLEKELLEWQKVQAQEELGRKGGTEMNPECSGGTVGSPRRPDTLTQVQCHDTDSEVRFNVLGTPKVQRETVGFDSNASTVPMGRNVTFAPQQQQLFPISSTPQDLHAAQLDLNKSMLPEFNPHPMSTMMPHAPHGMQGHVKPQRPLLVPDRYNGKAA